MTVKVGLVNKCTHYCGRSTSYRGIGKDFSILGNPFRMYKESQRDEVIDKYKDYFYWHIENDPNFRKAVDYLVEISKFENIVLGCFCTPKKCHCDVIKEYIDSRHKEWKS